MHCPGSEKRDAGVCLFVYLYLTVNYEMQKCYTGSALGGCVSEAVFVGKIRLFSILRHF